jgi:hypothetical protein
VPGGQIVIEYDQVDKMWPAGARVSKLWVVFWLILPASSWLKRSWSPNYSVLVISVVAVGWGKPRRHAEGKPQDGIVESQGMENPNNSTCICSICNICSTSFTSVSIVWSVSELRGDRGVSAKKGEDPPPYPFAWGLKKFLKNQQKYQNRQKSRKVVKNA